MIVRTWQHAVSQSAGEVVGDTEKDFDKKKLRWWLVT
jgi:hypothetical protein